MKRAVGLIAFLVPILVAATGLAGGGTSVSFENGRLSVTCDQAPLAEVLEEIEKTAGIELILEDEVKSKPLTANIVSEPVNFALQRLLSGARVNYALFFDPRDWQRVAKIFVGAGGEVVASAPNPVTGPRTRRVPPNVNQPEDVYPTEDENFDASMEEPVPDEMGVAEPAQGTEGDETFDAPAEEATPAQPNYVPKPPAFPRSRFTPGLESTPFGAAQPNPFVTQPNQANQPNQPGNRPPATYPFLDPFGRPIPVPPDQINTPQQQQDENSGSNEPPNR